MKYLVISTPHGNINTWRFCDCGSETYATIIDNGKTIICGGCDKEFESKNFTIKFMTTEPNRLFEESING